MSRILITAACLVTVAGCGSKGYRLAPVSGTVTMDGKPMVGAHVTFTPLGSKENSEPGPGSHAVTDSLGKFALKASTGKPGAIVGKHRVLIEAAQPAESASDSQSDGAESVEAFNARLAAMRSIPARYNRESKLDFDVPKEGTTAANFALNSKNEPRETTAPGATDPASGTDPAAQ